MEMVLDHYENPRNYGEIESASVIQEGGNPGCGDILKVYLKVAPDGLVEEISFSGEGCMLSQAGASIILESMKGKTVDQIDAEPAGIVVEMLGKRKAEMQAMEEQADGNTRLTYIVPTRGLLGFRHNFMTATRGNGILNSVFSHRRLSSP